VIWVPANDTRGFMAAGVGRNSSSDGQQQLDRHLRHERVGYRNHGPLREEYLNMTTILYFFFPALSGAAAVVVDYAVPRRIYELAGPSLGPYELIGPDKGANVLE